MKPEVPINIDFFALFMFLGIVQGAFLSFFFLRKENRNIKSNLFLGLFFITCSMFAIDVFLSETNLMFRVLHLNDFTEPLNLLIGPLLYLVIVAKYDEEKLGKYYLHFLPSILFLFYNLFYYLQPIELKYNSYIDQFHRNLEYLPISLSFPEDPLGIKNYISELGMLSEVVYISLAISIMAKINKKGEVSENVKKQLNKIIMGLAFVLVVFVLAKLFIPFGYGEYLIILAITLVLYIFTFGVIKDSNFFHGKLLDQKYIKSGLNEESTKNILNKIEKQFAENDFHLNPSASIGELSKLVGSSPNYVSQVINQQIGSTFPELLAKYRIESAKEMLVDPNCNETIEGIAYLVGYNSKSTFHTTFKKTTGQTPAEYKSSQMTR